MFPIKYIENNLVLNNDGEYFAYYELIPYNYAFLTPEQKEQIHESFKQVVASNREGRLHALCIATESSVRERQEKSKKHVRGDLKGIAFKMIDEQTELLIDSMYGKENEMNYRYFLGLKLLEGEQEFSFKGLMDNTIMTVSDFIGEVNHNLMGDFLTISNKEMLRYANMEKMLYKRLGKKFTFRRLEKRDFGYIVEHIYGQQKTPYYDYEYDFPVEYQGEKILVKKYDIIRLTRCLLEEHQRYVKLIREEGESYAAYLTINVVTGDLEFPSSEIFYYQQAAFDFPVDTSMNLEIIANKKALGVVRNKKKELKDLDEHAYTSGNETENSVTDALDDVGVLEQDLGQTKEPMYKLSYAIRVSAQTREELEERVITVRDYYENEFNIKLVRPFGDMLGLQQEFIPSSKRYMNDYVQYVKADFMAALGFGAARILGEEEGFFIGYDIHTGKNVYIDPSLPCQGVSGSVTNALAMSFTGSLGGGKSMSNNILLYWSVLFGARALILDPKSERGNWKDDLPELADYINIVNLTSEDRNKGMLDPYIIMQNKKDADSLAMDILTYLTGVSIKDGKRFPLLRRAVKNVTEKEVSGLLLVIDELREMQEEEAKILAEHIDSFTDYDFAKLLFSDGKEKHTINLEKQINIIQVQDLVLPDAETAQEQYTSMEMLSVAMMIVISTFALDFIHSDRSVFKKVDIDEAWTFLQVAQGKALSNKLVRAGRSMQAGVDFVTQNADDVGDEKMKNNIGMKFAFRSTDLAEQKKILRFYGLDPESEENQKVLGNLENGQCLFQDLYGHVGILKIECLFPHIFKAFDTRPPREEDLPDAVGAGGVLF